MADQAEQLLAGLWFGRSQSGAGGSSLLPALLSSESMRSCTQKLHYGVEVFVVVFFFFSQIIFKCSFVAKDDFT